MIAEKQTKSNIGVGVGFVIAVSGRVLAMSGASANSQSQVSLGQMIGFVGGVIFIWGCVNYAQAKGYSPWMGALGLLSCIGLLILVILPDKTKDGGLGGPGSYEDTGATTRASRPASGRPRRAPTRPRHSGSPRVIPRLASRPLPPAASRPPHAGRSAGTICDRRGRCQMQQKALPGFGRVFQGFSRVWVRPARSPGPSSPCL